MISTLLVVIDKPTHTSKPQNISFLTKLAGLTVLKRLILNFQFLGGENVLILGDSDILPDLKSDLSDKRIKLDIQYTPLSETDGIFSSLSTSYILVTEPSVFERDFLKHIMTLTPGDQGTRITVRNSHPDLMGSESHVETGFYLAPALNTPPSPQQRDTESLIPLLINTTKPLTTALGKCFYLNIKSRKDVRKGERGLLRFLRKPTDTLISRTLNRPVSLFFTRFLMKTSVTPNFMTLVTLVISLLSMWLVIQVADGWHGYFYGALAGILFHLASVVDGCDGEIARLKFQFSQTGEFLDGLVDDLKNGLFFGAVGYRCYLSLQGTNDYWANIYLYTALTGLGLFFIAKTIQYYQILTGDSESRDIFNYTYFFEEEDHEENPGGFSRVMLFFRDFARSDFLGLMAMIGGLLNIYLYGYWVFLGFLLGIFFSVLAQTIIGRKKKPL